MNMTSRSRKRPAAKASDTSPRLPADLATLLLPQDPVVDLGCGSGETCLDLAQSGYFHVRGVDLDAAAIEHARQVAERLAVRPVPRFLIADVTDLPLEDDSFAGAIMQALLATTAPVEERLAALREARRILKPGGRLFLAEFAQTWHDPTWRRRYLDGESLTGELGTFAVRDPQTGRTQSYAHHFSEEELVGLLTEAGFQVSELHKDTMTTTAGIQADTMAVVAVSMT